MAYVQVEPSGHGVTVLAQIEDYCQRTQVEAPKLNVSLTASAIMGEVGCIRRLIARIAGDKSIKPDAKREFVECLAALSLKMKRILKTQVPTGNLRAARTAQQGYLPELHGVRVLQKRRNESWRNTI